MENMEDVVSQHQTIVKFKDKLLKSIKEVQENLEEFKAEGHYDGVHDHVLTHGLRKHYTFVAGQFYTDVVYSPFQKEYLLVFPSKLIARYGLHGREISPPYKIDTTRFSKLTWAHSMQAFLCWGPELHEIYVAQADFVFLFKVYNDVPMVHVMYDEDLKTVIAAGESTITRYNYVLRTQVLQKKDHTVFKVAELAAVVIVLCDLAPSATGSQLLFASYFSSVYVINLDTKTLIDTRKALHSLRITALMLYLPVMWLITGDLGGTVKCWDATWNLMMVFIGHTNSVLHLVPHPTLCGFVSIGADNTLQVWSCTLRDKVERLELDEPVRSITVNGDEECLVTLSASCINVWYMHLLYSHHCVLNSTATALFTSMNPRHPCRTMVVTADSLVRVISPLTGVQLTVQHVPPSVNLVGVAYSADTEMIYTILDPNGDILLSRANENPVKFWKVWVRDSRGPQITAIAVYEYVASVLTTEVVARGGGYRTEHSLIFVGREDGHIASLDCQSGAVEFVTTAHTSGVKCLLANPASRQLVSCGTDSSIKVWRVLAEYRREPILLYVSLYYAQVIASVATLGEVLCLAISGPKSLIHTVVMYNVTEKMRHDHAAHRDHRALIVSMSTSETLGLCATASLDRTVRIWSEINQLQKVLELNTTPQQVCFSSLRGDITLCIGKHLFKIRHQRYLSDKYRHKIVLYRIPELIEEVPKTFERENVEISSESHTRILQPESSLPLLSLAVTGEVDKSVEMKRAKAYSQYNAREEDILNIMEGNTVASKKIPSRQLIGLKRWKKLIESIMTVSGVPQMLKVAGLKALNIREIRHRHEQKIQHLNLRAKYKGMFGGSFTGVGLANLPFNPMENPVANRGFIPNCILYKLLGIEVTTPGSVIREPTKRAVLPVRLRDHEDYGERGQGDSISSETDTDTYKSVNTRRMGTPASTSESEESEIKQVQVYSVQQPGGVPWLTACQTAEQKDTACVTAEETGVISGKKRRPRTKTPRDDPEPTQKVTEVESPTHVNAALELLATQFASEQSPDDSVPFDAFLAIFTNLLDAAKSDVDITTSVKNLYDNYAQKHRSTMNDALIKITETSKVKKETHRLEMLLTLFGSLEGIDPNVIAALLGLYILSGKSRRSMIMLWLTERGLVDPKRLLEKHLQGVMVDLNKQCKIEDALDFYLVANHFEKWLLHWQRTLEYHMGQVLEQLRSGEVTTGVDSFLVRELEKMAERFMRSEGGGSVDIDLERNTVEMIVVIDEDTSKKRMGHVNVVDALNYFCELEARFNGPTLQNRLRHSESCLRELHLVPDERTSWGARGHPPPANRIQMPLPKARLADPYNEGTYLPHPVLLTLRTSQKYFRPQNSYP